MICDQIWYCGLILFVYNSLKNILFGNCPKTPEKADGCTLSSVTVTTYSVSACHVAHCALTDLKCTTFEKFI